MPQNSLGQSGKGTILSIGGLTGASGTETFTPVSEIMDLPLKLPAWKTAPTTHLQSTTETAKKTIKGLTTIELKGTRVSTNAGQIIVMAAYQSTEPYDFKVVLPVNADAGQTTTGDTFTFSAFVMSAEFPIAPDKMIESNISLQLDGDVTFTAGS